MNRFLTRPLASRALLRIREIGLGRIVDSTVKAVDSPFYALGRPPLAARASSVPLRGYLRHRSFLTHLDERYERVARRLFREAARRATTIVDGGAHIGLYTIESAVAASSDCSIVALEPDPYNYSALLFNVKVLGERVTPLNLALSDRSGESEFFPSGGTISSSLIERPGVTDSAAIRVQTTTIGNEVAGLDVSRLLIKLDLEGAEVLALKGLERCLSQCFGCTVVAEHNPSLAQTETAADWLIEHGFECRFIDEGADELVPFDAARKGNILAVRESS